jgi:hypothetical protein
MTSKKQEVREFKRQVVEVPEFVTQGEDWEYDFDDSFDEDAWV